MDQLIERLYFEPLSRLQFIVGSIRFGWMEITLGNGISTLNYSVSYTVEPLNDILSALVWLLIDDLPQIRAKRMKGLMCQKNYAYVDHDREGSVIGWLFYLKNGELYVMIFENLDLSTYETLTQHNFDLDQLYEESIIDFTPEEFLITLKFAFKGSPGILINKLAATFDELETRNVVFTEDDTEFDAWGYRYSKEDLALLKNVID